MARTGRLSDTAGGGKQYLTPVEAAQLIWPDAEASRPGVSKATVLRLYDAGQLRGFRTPGGQRRIERASVDELNRVRRLPQRTAAQRAEYFAALADLVKRNEQLQGGAAEG